MNHRHVRHVAEVTRLYDEELARVFVRSLPDWPQGRAFPLFRALVKDKLGAVQDIHEGDMVEVVLSDGEEMRIVSATVSEPLPIRGRGGFVGRGEDRLQAVMELPPTTKSRV